MRKFGFLMLLLVAGVAVGYAQDVRLHLDTIKEGNASYATISGDFKQTKHLSFLDDDDMVSNGTLYYKKPDLMAMNYMAPEGDLMIINKDKFIMAVSGHRRETNAKSNAKMRGIRTILTSCMNGDFSEIGFATIACEESPDAYIVTVEIDKKVNKSGVSTVVAHYDKQDFSLVLLRMEEPDGSFDNYELGRKKLNQPIDDTVFNK